MAISITIEHTSDMELDRITNEVPKFELLKPFSQMATIKWPTGQSSSKVCVHRINQGADLEVVKFSKPEHAPDRGKCLQLAKLSYYRDSEPLPEPIGDSLDGTQRIDASKYIIKAINAPRNASLTAQITYSSPVDAWVYCTSVRPNRSSVEYEDLKMSFQKIGYTEIRVIQDPSTFALQLGIDYALLLNSEEYAERYETAKLGETAVSGNMKCNVQVIHGPVIYEDQSGEFHSPEVNDHLRPGMFCTFTKRTRYSDQTEYRFAVFPTGATHEDTLHLPVSEELSNLLIQGP